MQFFGKTNIDFLGKRTFFAMVSLAVILGGLAVSIFIGPELGIDFTGGTEIALKFDGNVEAKDVRQALIENNIEGAEVKSFGDVHSFLIRVKDTENGVETVNKAIAKKFSGIGVETLKVDKIGPKIGKELWETAIWAILLSVFFILIYIAFRFEFTFGIGAVVALIHDVTVTFTVIVAINAFGIADVEINQTILAAMLMVVGYSINDTVVIFDRIRENLVLHKGQNRLKIFNDSINETLSRTVNTSLTSAMVMITLLIFGGPVLAGFALTMLIGLIAGTYSSIFVASSFVVWYDGKMKKNKADTTVTKKTKFA